MARSNRMFVRSQILSTACSCPQPCQTSPPLNRAMLIEERPLNLFVDPPVGVTRIKNLSQRLWFCCKLYLKITFISIVWTDELLEFEKLWERLGPRQHAEVPRRATLLWVPGATHDSAAIYSGPMKELAAKGYSSVALHLQKSRCTSLSNYVGQAGILMGRSFCSHIMSYRHRLFQCIVSPRLPNLAQVEAALMDFEEP